MRRTLAEWENLWREQWDRNNEYPDLDNVFSDLEDLQEAFCELTITLNTKEGRIDTVLLTILYDGSALTEHEYSINELGRVKLNKLIESLNQDQEDEEDKEEVLFTILDQIDRVELNRLVESLNQDENEEE